MKMVLRTLIWTILILCTIDVQAQVNSTNGSFNVPSMTLPLSLQTNGTTRMTITGGTGTLAGNVGIGTTNTDARLAIGNLPVKYIFSCG